MRAIDADKVKAESREHCKSCILNGTKRCDKTCVINLICDRLDLQPTIEERKQGEWIDHSEDYGYVECPICGHLTSCCGDKDELHYCWNCGAKLGKGSAE